MASTALGAARTFLRTPRGKATRIILGSSSKVRRTLMDELCSEVGDGLLQYQVRTADIDEKAIRREKPEDLVTTLALAKAEAIKKKLESEDTNNTLLITCDQVVVHEGRILEKPESEEEVRENVEGYAKSYPSTVGAIAVTELSTGKVELEVDVANIHFESIPEESVETLIKEGEVFWAAGGLLVEHPLVQPHVVKIEGTMDGVMGLPKARVLNLLSKFF